MYIKDLMTGEVRMYGTNHHDALEVSSDGRTLAYENLQNGEGSEYGDYRFCNEKGQTPEEDEDLIKHGANAFFNIGGFFPHEDEDLEKIKSDICDHYCKYPGEYKDQDEMIDTVCVNCPLLKLDDVKDLEVKKMLNINDLPKTTVKQLAYENRTFLRAYLPIEPNAFVCASYEVSHNGRVYSYPDLQAAVNKFNEEVQNDL